MGRGFAGQGPGGVLTHLGVAMCEKRHQRRRSRRAHPREGHSRVVGFVGPSSLQHGDEARHGYRSHVRSGLRRGRPHVGHGSNGGIPTVAGRRSQGGWAARRGRTVARPPRRGPEAGALGASCSARRQGSRQTRRAAPARHRDRARADPLRPVVGRSDRRRRAREPAAAPARVPRRQRGRRQSQAGPLVARPVHIATPQPIPPTRVDDASSQADEHTVGGPARGGGDGTGIQPDSCAR